MSTIQYDISDDVPNTFGRGEITCPFCGEEVGDSWEIKSDEGTRVCDSCDSEFTWSRDITVEYRSDAPLKANTPSHD